MSRFFWSDPHFNHLPIIDYCERPFTSVEHMNQAMVDNWNTDVGPDDTGYLLGDLALGRNRIEIINDVIDAMNGHIVLIPGNHDLCWPGREDYNFAEWVGRYRDAGLEIEAVQVDLTLSDGTDVELCHFPYRGDHLEDGRVRYLQHRPTDNGKWLFHGHIHEKWLQWGRMINVGVDVWDFHPVSEARIVAMIAAGEQNTGKMFIDYERQQWLEAQLGKRDLKRYIDGEISLGELHTQLQSVIDEATSAGWDEADIRAALRFDA